MITKFGKRFLTDFIAGNNSFSGKEIALGICTNSEYQLSETNSRVGFEFYRVPVRFGGINIDSSVSPTQYTAIYSATVPPNVAGKINEMGLYPGNRNSRNTFDSKFITDFDLPYDWSPVPDIDQVNYRIGNSSLIFESNGSSPQEYNYSVSMDISGYSIQDTISFSYKVNDSNLSSIKLRFYSSSSDYYEMIFTGHSVGWNVKELNLSNLSATGNPKKTDINSIGIIIVPTSSQTSVTMDGLRINDEDTFDPTYGLISRSIVDTIEKVSGRELLIEYKLDISFGV